MAAKRTGPNGGDLRRHILDTTRHLLVQNGYKNLSMRRIARAIGYSATSIYLHFENKDHLIHALIEEGMERLHEELQAVETAHPDDPTERLRALGRTFVRFGLENPEYYEIMFLLRTEHMERFPAEKFRRARRNLDVIAEALREGAERGIFRVEDPRVAASSAWAALHGLVSLLLARRVDVRIDQDELIETTIRQLVTGLRAHDPAPSPLS